MFSWYLYQMVSQNMLRTYDVKQVKHIRDSRQRPLTDQITGIACAPKFVNYPIIYNYHESCCLCLRLFIVLQGQLSCDIVLQTSPLNTACPRSLVHFHIVSYFVKNGQDFSAESRIPVEIQRIRTQSCVYNWIRIRAKFESYLITVQPLIYLILNYENELTVCNILLFLTNYMRCLLKKNRLLLILEQLFIGILVFRLNPDPTICRPGSGSNPNTKPVQQLKSALNPVGSGIGKKVLFQLNLILSIYFFFHWDFKQNSYSFSSFKFIISCLFLTLGIGSGFYFI